MRVDGKVTRRFRRSRPWRSPSLANYRSHSRTVALRSTRYGHQQEQNWTRFDELNVEQNVEFRRVYRAIFHWARQCELNPNPPMPHELRNRVADNWRCSLSIADACGPEWGKRSCEAAIAISKSDSEEDMGVMLLRDIRDVFDRRPTVDRLTSEVIVADLKELPDGIWDELSKNKLARLLKPFGIRPGTIWRPGRETNDKSAKGYLRSQFEAPWQAYCDSAPSQRGNVRYLRGG